jgi:hypothetical protein
MAREFEDWSGNYVTLVKAYKFVLTDRFGDITLADIQIDDDGVKILILNICKQAYKFCMECMEWCLVKHRDNFTFYLIPPLKL